MLVHIVCWKYKRETDASTRTSHIDGLRELPPLIDCISTFEVGSDILHLDRSFDIGLVATFAGRDELDRYTHHPEHQRIAALGKQIAESVVSVDFETAESRA